MHPAILGDHGDEKLMKVQPEPFSEIIKPWFLEYTVHGTIDRDGNVNITEVTLKDSTENIWLDYEGTSLGDKVQEVCDAIVAGRNEPSIYNEVQE